MSIYNILLASGRVVVPGSQTFTTPGSTTFTVPAYNTMTVEIWGAGGAGGDSAQLYTTGGGGGGGYYSRWSIPPYSLAATENIFIGAGGYSNGRPPPYGSDNRAYRAGEYSVFGNYAWSQGGYGGYDFSGSYGPFPAATYTPPAARPFTLIASESGANGGSIGSWNGQNATYAGAGGGAWTSVTGQIGSGGTSVYGGNGGAGGVSNPGVQPGGGSGATNTGFSPYTCAQGGAGKIVITWS